MASLVKIVEFGLILDDESTRKNTILGVAAGFGPGIKTTNPHNNQPPGANRVWSAR